jgi:hypothetical protein
MILNAVSVHPTLLPEDPIQMSVYISIFIGEIEGHNLLEESE